MRQTANLGVVQYSGIWKVPSAVGSISVTCGDSNDTFSWSAPANNGGPITKYGYQVSTDNGSTWRSNVDGALNGETEVATTSAVLATQYKTSSYRIRVRAFNAAGWGPYSTISSSSTVAWSSITNECPAGQCSQTQTDTACPAGTCSQSQSDSCSSCGSRFRTRTRTWSRTRTRTRTSQFFRRLCGSTTSESSVTYGAWSISDAEWNLGAGSTVGWSAGTYSSWSISDAQWDLGTGSTEGWTGSCGTWNFFYDFVTVNVINGTYPQVEFTAFGPAYVSGGTYVTCDGGSGLLGPVDVQQCSSNTGTYRVAGGDVCFYPSCC